MQGPCVSRDAQRQQLVVSVKCHKAGPSRRATEQSSLAGREEHATYNDRATVAGAENAQTKSKSFGVAQRSGSKVVRSQRSTDYCQVAENAMINSVSITSPHSIFSGLNASVEQRRRKRAVSWWQRGREAWSTEISVRESDAGPCM